jgi:UDP-N-acetyl-2-amino-2-deoxyglucuronate dehydrogenase
MEHIRFAIIGCGRIAARHARQIRVFGELLAVCDIVESKAEALAKEYSAPYFIGIDALFNAALPIDVVVICTPNGLHEAHAVLSLSHGYHVLVEKPMALTSAGCNRMIQVAEKVNKRLFIVVQNRFNPPVIAVKKALDVGAFGKISSLQLTCFWNRSARYYVDAWKGTKELDGGTLYSQFSHFIDLLHHWFGELRSVQAITSNSQHQGIVEFEDCGVVTLVFENGIIGTIHFSVNSFEKNQEGSLAILGEKGMVKIGGEYLNTIEYARFSDHDLELDTAGAPANDYGHYQGSMSNHDKVYESLVNNLLHDQPYYAESIDGLHTVALIERIYASAQDTIQ